MNHPRKTLSSISGPRNMNRKMACRQAPRMSNKNEKDPPSSHPSDSFVKMPLSVWRRILDELFLMLAEYPEPDSPDLRDLRGRTRMDIEYLFKHCIIARVAKRRMRGLQEIVREQAALMNGSLDEEMISFIQSQGTVALASSSDPDSECRN